MSPSRPATSLDRASLTRLMKRSWPMLKPQRRAIVGVTLLTMAATALSLAGPWCLRYGIDRGAMQGDSEALTKAVIGYSVALIMGVVVARAQLLTLTRVGQRFLRELRIKLFAHLQSLSLDFHDRSDTGVLVSRMTSDIGTLAQLVSSGLPTMVMALVLLVATTGFLFMISWQLALVAMAVAPLLGLSSRKFQRDADAAYLEVRDDTASLLTEVQQAMSGMRVTQAFAQEQPVSARCQQANARLAATHMRSAWVQVWYFAVVEFSWVGTAALIVGVGGWMVAASITTVGTVTLFLLSIGKVFEPVQQLSQFFNTLQSAGSGLRKVFGILDCEPSVAERSDATELAAVGELVAEDLGFSYPEPFLSVSDESAGKAEDAASGLDGASARVGRLSEPVDSVVTASPGSMTDELDCTGVAHDGFALSGVSLRLKPGDRLALVGATGAGKSTLAKLLCRLYDPTSGHVSLAGTDLRDATLESLRTRIVLIPQEGFLFQGSVLDNVLLARPGAGAGEAERALERVGALERFRKLPDGLETDVAQLGARLSAGERQLVSLARAFIADPAVLVLDEATANLDPGLEATVTRALDVLNEGRIMVVIAHRLASAERATCVAVVDGGRVVQLASPAVLASRAGLYRDLRCAWLEGSGMDLATQALP